MMSTTKTIRILYLLASSLLVALGSVACATSDGGGGSDALTQPLSAADAKSDTKDAGDIQDSDAQDAQDTQTTSDGVAMDSLATQSDADTKQPSLEAPNYRVVYLPVDDTAASSAAGQICAWQDPSKVSLDDQMALITAEWEKWSDGEREDCLWSRFGGRAMVQDNETNQWVLQKSNGDLSYSDTETRALLDELNVPDEIQCIADEDLEEGSPSTLANLTKGKGTDDMPEKMDASWSGSDQGGCATWASLMCDRILGEASGEVTKDEWNDVADDLDSDGDGSAGDREISERYRDMGYTVEITTSFKGTTADYEKIKEAMNRGCDVKIGFVRADPWLLGEDGKPQYTNGHVETVTGVDPGAKSASTNSWGSSATITGGSNNFSHSRDKSFVSRTRTDAAQTWPKTETHMDVFIICPKDSSILESIIDFLFG